MDFYKYAEKAEILYQDYCCPPHVESVITMKIRGEDITAFNPCDLSFENGITCYVYLMLLTTGIIKEKEFKMYTCADKMSNEKQFVITTGNGDCIAKGKIVDIERSTADENTIPSRAIFDCGVYIEIEIPPNSYNIGDSIVVEGRLDIDNTWKESVYGSSPTSDRF